MPNVFAIMQPCSKFVRFLKCRCTKTGGVPSEENVFLLWKSIIQNLCSYSHRSQDHHGSLILVLFFHIHMSSVCNDHRSMKYIGFDVLPSTCPCTPRVRKAAKAKKKRQKEKKRTLSCVELCHSQLVIWLQASQTGEA